MRTLLILAIPPLAGAVIGFITNVVAIRMLFRPLKEIRVFGIRLPFTPGLLPRQRHKLADNIGAMVERELLTPEIIRGRLRREEVRGGIKNSVARYTETLLRRPLGEVLDAGPAASPLRDFGLSLFQGFASSPVCDELIGLFSGSLAETLLSGGWPGRSLRELLGPEEGEKLLAGAEDFIAGELTGGAERFSQTLAAEAEKLYPAAAAQIIRFLNRSGIRQQLEEQGRVFLTNVILKLNVFQRFFISTAQYDKTLHDRMPEIIDDLISQLKEMLSEEDTRRKILQWARESLYRAFSGEKASRQAARFLTRLLSAQMDRPLDVFLRKAGAGGLQPLIQNLLGGVKERVFASPEGGPSPFFALLAARLRERYGAMSLEAALSLGPEKKEALDARIGDQILRIADEQAAAALEAVNVRDMVAERIDSLDMIRVERIILDVMANQLKWIDVFGGILGFLIGLGQSLFSWFFRQI
jgi:uncharacterized membrane-anchored protein YjiN (DUF445 family)